MSRYRTQWTLRLPLVEMVTEQAVAIAHTILSFPADFYTLYGAIQWPCTTIDCVCYCWFNLQMFHFLSFVASSWSSYYLFGCFRCFAVVQLFPSACVYRQTPRKWKLDDCKQGREAGMCTIKQSTGNALFPRLHMEQHTVHGLRYNHLED